MARTAGSYSLASIEFRELVRQVAGDEIANQIQYKGYITISKNWIDSHLNPQCEMVMIAARDIANPLIVRPNANGEAPLPIEMTRANPPVEVQSQCAPKVFTFSDDESEEIA